jgi:transposase
LIFGRGWFSSGLSCPQAAIRFGVSASSAIRWRALHGAQGDAKPKAVGGDRRSMRMERNAGVIRALVEETPDLTFEELKTALAA